MQKSVETRWFLPGMIPPQVKTWFQEDMVMPQPSRIDLYLHTTGVHDLGIKLREGRIELKQRLNELGQQTFHPRVTGFVESWGKWSFLVSDANYSEQELSGNWIPVEKTRSIRRYQVTPDEDIRAVPGWLFPVQRSTIEIAEIIINNTTWWSLNLEVVGTEIDLLNALQTTADMAFHKSGMPSLSITQSFSYPQWLDYIVNMT
jgi:hypothetical protein